MDVDSLESLAPLVEPFQGNSAFPAGYSFFSAKPAFPTANGQVIEEQGESCQYIDHLAVCC